MMPPCHLQLAVSEKAISMGPIYVKVAAGANVTIELSSSQLQGRNHEYRSQQFGNRLLVVSSCNWDLYWGRAWCISERQRRYGIITQHGHSIQRPPHF